jgi:hypothetical protein
MSENPYALPGLPDPERKAPPKSSRTARNILVEAVLEFLAAWWFWKTQVYLPLTLIFVALGLYALLQLCRKFRANVVGEQLANVPPPNQVPKNASFQTGPPPASVGT